MAASKHGQSPGAAREEDGASSGNQSLEAATSVHVVKPESAAVRSSGSRLRVGQSVVLTAGALDAQGAGVCAHGDRQIHVPGLLPSESADVLIRHLSPHSDVAWGSVNRRLCEAAERCAPACLGYGLCGGCSLQHLRYDAQLRWKGERFAQALSAVPGAAAAVRACAAPSSVGAQAEPSPGPLVLPLGYRSRVKLVAAEQVSRGASATPPQIYLGSYVPRSHSVLPMEGCRVNAAGLTAIARTLTAQLNRLGVRAYDEATGQGALRYVLLRESARGEQQLGLVVAERPDAAALTQLTQALIAAHPTLVSIVLHHNRSAGNALLTDEEPDAASDAADLCLHGTPYLWDEVAGVSLRISARSFFQVHREVAAQIYSDVAALLRSRLQPAAQADATTPLRIVDVYCGVGGLGLSVAAQLPACSLLGLEWSTSAIADAQASANRLGLGERSTFHCGAAEALLVQPGLREQASAASAVLLNPPRRGCTPEVLSALATLQPRYLVYVSCSPESLARDLSFLLAAGYAWVQSTPYDMHPGTPHIESVTLLQRP